MLKSMWAPYTACKAQACHHLHGVGGAGQLRVVFRIPRVSIHEALPMVVGCVVVLVVC